MKELTEIVTAFHRLCQLSKPAALATVIEVSGSAYRRPGARMLIAEDGATWGGVSGGCLERDVALRARGVIATGRPITCRYDTTDDEDLATGVATGCRGTVDLFIEPVSSERAGPFPWLERVVQEKCSLSFATIVKTDGRFPAVPSDRFSPNDSSDPACLLLANGDVPKMGLTRVHTLRGWAEVFFERVSPPQSLVIFGGGPDAVPVVTIAKALGWNVTVVASRPATNAAKRFAHADKLFVTSSEEPTEGVDLRADGAVVLMTHNFTRDVAILRGLPVRPKYLGILGPRSRTDELIAAAGAIPFLADAYGPIGLDIGSETADEIALAILAEIQAVLRNATGVSLRDRPGPIHSSEQRASGSHETNHALRSFACPM